MELLLILIIAVSLSMDAFSLSLAYGTLNLDKKTIYKLSIIVGVYHFFMPLFGMLVGTFITSTIPISPSLLVFLILAFIGLQMIFESFKKEEYNSNLNLYQLLLFGLAVSIDSFSVGIGINNISNNFLLCSCIFSLTSLVFTYIGLKLGDKLNQLIGKVATLMGGIMLVILGIIYVIK